MGGKVDKLQLQLGQITEMIHVASLIHDDVLDEADTRRGGKFPFSRPALFTSCYLHCNSESRKSRKLITSQKMKLPKNLLYFPRCFSAYYVHE